MAELDPATWVLVVLVASAASVWVSLRVARLRRERRGWWVEVLGSAQLRGEADELAVVYHEGQHSLWIGGRALGQGARAQLAVPSAGDWDATVESWARGRRDEILERVRGDTYVQRQVEPFA